MSPNVTLSSETKRMSNSVREIFYKNGPPTHETLVFSFSSVFSIIGLELFYKFEEDDEYFATNVNALQNE
jgi:hypothetical protein